MDSWLLEMSHFYFFRDDLKTPSGDVLSMTKRENFWSRKMQYKRLIGWSSVTNTLTGQWVQCWGNLGPRAQPTEAICLPVGLYYPTPGDQVIASDHVTLNFRFWIPRVPRWVYSFVCSFLCFTVCQSSVISFSKLLGNCFGRLLYTVEKFIFTIILNG